MVTKRQEIVSKIAYYIFYVAVIVEVLLVLIDKSAYTNPIEGRIFQITFLLFLIKVCLTKYSWKEYLAVGLFLGLGAISYFVTGRNEIVRVVMFVAACKDIDMQKCLKLVFYMTLVGCIAIMSLSLVGIGGDISLTQDYGRGSVETRYILGMGHPNALQCMVWALTVLGLYLYGEKMKWYGYLVLLGVNVFFFLLTDSKTSLIAAAFAILTVFILKILKYKKTLKIGMLLSIGTTILVIGFSVFIASQAYRLYNYIWYGTNNWQTQILLKFDNVLTGRIRTLTGTTRWEGTIQTWKLFSEPANNYYFDMGWIRLFYWYGIIPATIIVLLLIVWMIYCYKKEKYEVLAVIVSFSIYTILEAHAVSVYIARNYLFFLFGVMWADMLVKSNWKENT